MARPHHIFLFSALSSQFFTGEQSPPGPGLHTCRSFIPSSLSKMPKVLKQCLCIPSGSLQGDAKTLQGPLTERADSPLDHQLHQDVNSSSLGTTVPKEHGPEGQSL